MLLSLLRDSDENRPQNDESVWTYYYAEKNKRVNLNAALLR